jgi:hypothetical protein
MKYLFILISSLAFAQTRFVDFSVSGQLTLDAKESVVRVRYIIGWRY